MAFRNGATIIAFLLLFLPACKHYLGNPYPHAGAPRTVPAAGDALRLEPPNWWAGMSGRQVELLVCRPGIRDFGVRLGEAKGIVLEKTEAGAGADSVYLTLNIAPDAPPQRLPLLFSRAGSDVRFTAEFPLYRRNTASKAAGLDTRRVLCRPAETAQDSVSGLNALQDMGITAVWLPADPPAHPYAANRQWPAPDLFRDWVRQCHYRDIRVVRDLIPRNMFIDPCGAHLDERAYNALLQQALWWVEYAGLDGFQVDSCAGEQASWRRRLFRALRDEYPAVFLGAVDADPLDNIALPGGAAMAGLVSAAATDPAIKTAVLLTVPGLPLMDLAGGELSAAGFARALIRYRNATPALQNGQAQFFPPADGVYAWFRFDAEKTVMILVNTGEKARRPDSDRFTGRLAGFTRAKDVISGEIISGWNSLEAGGNKPRILELMK